MPRESKQVKSERAQLICKRLDARYHTASSALDYTTPFTLVVCVMLSAQTTDASVNRVTPELFSRWPGPFDMAKASIEDVGSVIKTIGLWRAKAKHCVELSQMLVTDFGGNVPHTMEELTRLPGVGRKTANIVLNKAFGKVDGIAVDTHVYRLAQRFCLTRAATPLAAEKDLLKLLPPALWRDVNEQWIHFGREYCSAKKPDCEHCFLQDICPSFLQPDRYLVH